MDFVFVASRTSGMNPDDTYLRVVGHRDQYPARNERKTDAQGGHKL